MHPKVEKVQISTETHHNSSHLSILLEVQGNAVKLKVQNHDKSHKPPSYIVCIDAVQPAKCNNVSSRERVELSRDIKNPNRL